MLPTWHMATDYVGRLSSEYKVHCTVQLKPRWKHADRISYIPLRRECNAIIIVPCHTPAANALRAPHHTHNEYSIHWFVRCFPFHPLQRHFNAMTLMMQNFLENRMLCRNTEKKPQHEIGTAVLPSDQTMKTNWEQNICDNVKVLRTHKIWFAGDCRAAECRMYRLPTWNATMMAATALIPSKIECKRCVRRARACVRRMIDIHYV